MAAGGTLSAPTVAGEEWIVREGGAEVLRVVSTDDKVQRADRRAQARGRGAVGAVVAAHGGAAEGGDRAGDVTRGHGCREGRGEAEAVAAHAADGRNRRAAVDRDESV